MGSGCLRGLVAFTFCVSLALATFPRTARAEVPLIDGFGGPAGYGVDCLGPNDDGSSAILDISPFFPAGLQFFDDLHTSLAVNTNGNVTFSGQVPTFTPIAFPIADMPMIAPFWGDVDIRMTGGVCTGPIGGSGTAPACHNPTENGVWWHLEAGRMVVTWDRVGYYNCHNDNRMSFQLVISTPTAECTAAGDFDVEFRFNLCQWETGDASGGSGGFGGTPAQAGFDAGNLMDFVEIMGSRMPGIATEMCTGSNVGTPGLWQFQIRGGTVVCPDAGAACDTGADGVCGDGRTHCDGDGTVCVQEVEPADERCDALDNDCDGATDEGDALCAPTEACIRGICVPACFEGNCPEGLECVKGECVDPACVTIDCPEGERCVGGVCLDACDGVVCPAGLSCRGGRCVDLCEGQTCDDCTVCEDGLCVVSCDFTPCSGTDECNSDGHCVPPGCVDVDCGVGMVCAPGGGCVDACDGAVCPSGEECIDGECVQSADDTPDAGPVGPTPDASTTPGGPDAGPGGGDGDGDGGDGGAADGTDSGGCCSTTGQRNSGTTALLVFGLALWWRRRRR